MHSSGGDEGRNGLEEQEKIVCDDTGEPGGNDDTGELGGNDGRATSRKKPGKGGYSGEGGMTSFLGLKGEEEKSYEGNSGFM